MKKPILVETAANICRTFAYKLRNEINASFIIAGWDPIKKGQVIRVSFNFVNAS